MCHFTFPEHCRCCPGTDREVTNMVIQRSMNTVPIRLHMRRNRMDLGSWERVNMSPIWYWFKEHSLNIQENGCQLQGNTRGQNSVRPPPVFVQQQNQQPDVAEDDSTCLSHGKGPWYSRHTKEKKKIKDQTNYHTITYKNQITQINQKLLDKLSILFLNK